MTLGFFWKHHFLSKNCRSYLLGQLKSKLGSGCSSVGRAVASYNRSPKFDYESRHRQHLYLTLLSVNRIETTKIIKRRPGMPILKKTLVKLGYFFNPVSGHTTDYVTSSNIFHWSNLLSATKMTNRVGRRETCFEAGNSQKMSYNFIVKSLERLKLFANVWLHIISLVK